MNLLSDTINEKLSKLSGGYDHCNRSYIVHADDNIIRINYIAADKDEYTMLYIMYSGDYYYVSSSDVSLPYIRYPIRCADNMIDDIIYALNNYDDSTGITHREYQNSFIDEEE